MIVMINGSFGSGKTSAAIKLSQLLPNSMIYDPEEVGYLLRNVIREEDRMDEERTDDFQDLDLWKVLTVKIAKELKDKYNKHLIVPMTIYKTQNFDYIHKGFQDIDANLYHFCLLASVETLHKRMKQRGDTPGGWTFQQLEKCIHHFGDTRFGEHILTDHIETEEVVNTILTRITE
ncbi:AAA family ATPase [Paenibacillus sp. sgz500958]|uniref:AAA family ATPase n=1 Tax=Paenibacillus sp. sgz500958 TaxID=3242475 RepID=UPI0036D312DB